MIALAASQIPRNEFALQAEQVLVEGQLAVVYVEGVQVAKISVRVEIARLEDCLTRSVFDGDTQPDEPLRVEPGGHAVSVRAVAHLDLETQLAATRFQRHDLVQLVARLQELQALLGHFIQELQLRLDDLSRTHPAGA